jgi:PcfJ-like protein
MDYRLELLRDECGVFGMESTGDLPSYGRHNKIIVRPDMPIETTNCILQMVPNTRRLFRHSQENLFRQRLHIAMLHRHYGTDDWRWGEFIPAEERRKRRGVYHGLRAQSYRIVNTLLSQVLASADQTALKAARRFPPGLRGDIYSAFCVYGLRAVQLTDTFPLLAVALFTDRFTWDKDNDDDGPFTHNWERRRRERKAKDREMRQMGIGMVLKGVRLNKIADAMDISYCLRHIKPGATGRMVSCGLVVEAIGCLPKTTRRQKLFLAVLSRLKAKTGGAGTARWVGEFFKSIKDHTELAELDEIVDWLRASEIKGIPEEDFHIVERFHLLGLVDSVPTRQTHGAEFITRSFSPDMSLKTVRKLTAEWHEAIANNITEGEIEDFPEPWIDGAEIDAHKIVPITDSRELYLASKALHNCAATYAQGIGAGRFYLYTVSNGDGRPAVMVELSRTDEGVTLGQVKGYCNGPAPKEIERAVRRWFHRNRETARIPKPRADATTIIEEQGRYLWRVAKSKGLNEKELHEIIRREPCGGTNL